MTNKNKRMLKSFVSERDYPLLLDILEKVKLGTLKETVSVLNIYGDYYSSKIVLCKIMKKIAPSYDKSYIESKSVTSFLHPIVFVNENDKNELVDKIHRRCNTGMLFERLYRSDAGIHHPGVLVIPSRQKLDIKVGDPEKMILEPLSGTPFRDRSEEINSLDRKFESLDEKKEKKPRYPLYLELSYNSIFAERNDSDKIIEESVKEFEDYFREKRRQEFYNAAIEKIRFLPIHKDIRNIIATKYAADLLKEDKNFTTQQ